MPSAAAIKAGAAYVELALRKAKFESGLVQAERSLENFSRAFLKVGAAITGLGAGLAVPFVLASQKFIEFDDALRFIRATTSATREEMELLETTMENLGRTTSYRLSQIGQASVALSKAGFNSKEVNEAIGAVLDLDRATGAGDLALATDTAAKVLRGFGLEATEMNRVVDVLAITANNSAQSLEDLFEAIKLVTAEGRPGKAQNLEDIAAAIGVLANAGLTGSISGTSVRRITTNLGTKQDEIKQLLGIDPARGTKDLANFVEVLAEIIDKMKDLGTAEQARILNDIFEVRGKQAAEIIGANIVGYDELREKLTEVGYAAKITAELEGGLGGATRRLVSVFEDLVKQIGESTAVFADWIDGLNASIAQSSKWIEKNQEIVQAVAVTAAGLIAVGSQIFATGVALNIGAFAFGGYVKAVRGVESAISGVNGLLKSFSVVIGGLGKVLLSPVFLIAEFTKTVYLLSRRLFLLTANWVASNAAIAANRTLLLANAAAMAVYQAAVTATAASSMAFQRSAALLYQGMALIQSGIAIAGAALLGITARIYSVFAATTVLTQAITAQGLAGGLTLVRQTAAATAATMTLLQRGILRLASSLASLVAASIAGAIAGLASLAVRMGASIAFVQETVGKLVVAVGTNLVGYLTRVFYIAISRITDGISLIGKAVGQAIGAAIEFFAVFIAEAAKAAARFVGGFVSVVLQGLASITATILGSVISAIFSLFVSISSVLLPAIVAIGAAIAAIKFTIQAVIVASEEFKELFGEIRTRVGETLSAIAEIGGKIIGAFAEFGNVFSEIFKSLSDQFGKVSEAVGQLFSDLTSLFNQFFEIGNAAERGTATAKDAMESFKAVVRETVEFIRETILTLRDSWDLVILSFKKAWNQMIVELAEAWDNGFANAIIAGDFSTAIQIAFKSIKLELLKTFNDIFAQLGVSKDQIADVLSSITGVISEAERNLGNLFKFQIETELAQVDRLIGANLILSLDPGYRSKGLEKDKELQEKRNNLQAKLEYVERKQLEAAEKQSALQESIQNAQKSSPELFDVKALQKELDALNAKAANAENSEIEKRKAEIAAINEEIKRQQVVVAQKQSERLNRQAQAAEEGVKIQQKRISEGSAGTFSAAAAGRLGVGSSIDQKQLDELKQLRNDQAREAAFERKERKRDRMFQERWIRDILNNVGSV